MVITHAFVSGKTDSPDSSLVRPTNWNATHVIDPETTYIHRDHLSGAVSTRQIEFQEGAILISGTINEITDDNVAVLSMDDVADSEFSVWFRVPPDISTNQDIVLLLNFKPNAAPGVVNNQVRIRTTAKTQNTLRAQTAGDIIVLANNTDWDTYTGTVNIVAAGDYSIGDIIQVRIERDITVANNAAVFFNVGKVAFRFDTAAEWALTAADQVRVVGVTLTERTQFSRILFRVTTADGGAGLYDVGIYDSSGTLQADIGPTLFTPVGDFDEATDQGSVTLDPGKYLWAFTGDATVARIKGADSLHVTFANNIVVAESSTGGDLPASITAPADAWVTNGSGAYFALR